MFKVNKKDSRTTTIWNVNVHTAYGFWMLKTKKRTMCSLETKIHFQKNSRDQVDTITILFSFTI